ncbi:hypothetical protein JCM1393_01260 [Clostridium carnis]
MIKKIFFTLILSILIFINTNFLPTVAVTLDSNLSQVPVSDIYKKGIYNFDITCTKCEAHAKLITPDKNSVIMVINSDDSLRLFKKCTPDDSTATIGHLTKNDTVIIVGDGEFSIDFIR